MLRPEGLSRFDELRRRAATQTAILYAFDLIQRDGEDVAGINMIIFEFITVRDVQKWNLDSTPPQPALAAIAQMYRPGTAQLAGEDRRGYGSDEKVAIHVNHVLALTTSGSGLSGHSCGSNPAPCCGPGGAWKRYRRAFIRYVEWLARFQVQG